MVGAMVENGANPDVFGPLYVKILKRTLASVLEVGHPCNVTPIVCYK